MVYNRNRALELLKVGTGNPDATFRDGQEEAIREIVEGSGWLLLVQRAGWGKSFVYFIASKLLRKRGGGPALLISPLLSLMRNQILAAKEMGVSVATINSSNFHEWDFVKSQIRQDQVDVLLIAPERLRNEGFINDVLDPISDRISFLIVDEAHCISDWGHDFRPDYQRINRIRRYFPENMRLLPTTATVNDRVMQDLEQFLGSGLKIIRGDL